jgi:hypothetical protein
MNPSWANGRTEEARSEANNTERKKRKYKDTGTIIDLSIPSL